MFIDPVLHEQFVQEFGLNMVNTLTNRNHRVVAHREGIHVFDECGGVMGGAENLIQAYQNLTTGVFHSSTRKLVGVRYRCDPDALDVTALGAFHTHPACFDDDLTKLRRRIDQLLWMSEMDIDAFRRQHRIFGYRWHFIGCVDLACFHIDDIRKGRKHPRYVQRYPHLKRLVAQLRPEILHYDRVLAELQPQPPER
ncbi:MAG: hypothetical protein VKP62_01060 [Candidatus Sericytochromatia bacterium]|nr:hypothetical protein [Candidatus Sericytochromatia bacterium]